MSRLKRYACRTAMLLPIVAGMLGKTPVSFRTPKIYPVAEGAVQMAAGDFNGDGYTDLATTNNYLFATVVSILLNDGHGNFRAAVSYSAGNQPTALAVGDFNGDGKPDLAITDDNGCETYQCAGSISILLGNGDGTFQPPITFSAGLGPGAIAAGDFNGDGKLDLVFTNYGYIGEGDTLGVLLGNGDGTFQPEVDYSVGYGPNSVAIADFNGDRKLDIAVGNGSGISILLGNGDGTFTAGNSIGLDVGLNAIVAGDLDSDGKQDLVACGQYNANNKSIYVFLGNGDGTFQPGVSYPGQRNPFAMVLGDFNRDGHPDLAVANASGERRDPATPGISILLGNGDGTLTPAGTYSSGGNNQGIVAADFNHDGNLDLATSIGGAVEVLQGFGKGQFQKADTYNVVDPSSIAVADFNGDGKLDMAVATYEPASVSIFLGNGDGTFQAPVSIGTPENPGSIVAADFNHDGKPDLVMTNAYLNGVSIMLGNGDGTFQPAVSYPVANNASTLIVGDFNGDGHPDIAAFVYNLDTSGTISILLGNGDGTFQPFMTLATGTTIHLLAAADFNGDGKLDLAACNEIPSTISILLGNGNGTFQRSMDTPISGYCGNLAVADLNGDGKPDLVVNNVALEDDIGSISTMLGKGNGTFGPAYSISPRSTRSGLWRSPISTAMGFWTWRPPPAWEHRWCCFWGRATAHSTHRRTSFQPAGASITWRWGTSMATGSRIWWGGMKVTPPASRF